MSRISLTRVAIASALALGLSACAQQKTLYTWDGYQPSVYAYLKQDGADYAAQAQALEKSAEKARSSAQALPPGFRAHLALLYLKLGQDDKAAEQMEGEKNAFPESSPFMDFLMRNKSQPIEGMAKVQTADSTTADAAKDTAAPAAAKAKSTKKGE